MAGSFFTSRKLELVFKFNSRRAARDGTCLNIAHHSMTAGDDIRRLAIAALPILNNLTTGGWLLTRVSTNSGEVQTRLFRKAAIPSDLPYNSASGTTAVPMEVVAELDMWR